MYQHENRIYRKPQEYDGFNANECNEQYRKINEKLRDLGLIEIRQLPPDSIKICDDDFYLIKENYKSWLQKTGYDKKLNTTAKKLKKQ